MITMVRHHELLTYCVWKYTNILNVYAHTIDSFLFGLYISLLSHYCQQLISSSSIKQTMPFSWIPKGGAGGGLSLLVLGTAALLGVVHGQWRAMVTKGQREK